MGFGSIVGRGAPALHPCGHKLQLEPRSSESGRHGCLLRSGRNRDETDEVSGQVTVQCVQAGHLGKEPPVNSFYHIILKQICIFFLFKFLLVGWLHLGAALSCLISKPEAQLRQPKVVFGREI